VVTAQRYQRGNQTFEVEIRVSVRPNDDRRRRLMHTDGERVSPEHASGSQVTEVANKLHG